MSAKLTRRGFVPVLAASCYAQSAFPRTGGTLRVQWTGDAELLSRPHLQRLIGDSLSQLAVVIKQGQFSIRPDTVMHDGSRLTASLAASIISRVPGVEATADRDVVTISAEDAQAWDRILDAPLLHSPETGPPIGTGAFRIESLKTGKLTLAAHAQHWRGRPFVDSIELSSGSTAFPGDIVELAATQPARSIPEGYRLYTSSPSELICVTSASAIQPLLLQALDLAIDRASLCRVLLQRRAEPAGSLLPNWISGYARLLLAGRDLARAQSLLAAVRLMPLDLAIPADDTVLRLIAERIALNARDAGIVLRTVPGGKSDLSLRRIPIFHAAPAPALRATLLSLDIPVRMPAARPAIQNVLDAERAALSTGRLLPAAHLSRSFAIASRVRVHKRTETGEPSLADVWIEP